MALTLLLARHGQTAWNEAGLLQGQAADIPLTDLARAQAVTSPDGSITRLELAA